MRLLRTRGFLIALAAVVLGVPGALLLAGDRTGDGSSLTRRASRGDFTVAITTSGELRAREFVQITGPANTQQVQVYQMKISSIVPEGSIVKEGDVVAELDRSTLSNKMNEFSLALQKAEAVHEQAMLDSTLNLSKAREDIRTMELGLEEKRLAKEQAVYEAPTVRRQAEIDLEKAERALIQARLDYKTKTEQAQAKMREVGADLQRQRNQVAIVQDVMAGFTVKAPTAGMVIYVREWNGRKRTTGSQIGSWDPTVATLPDLSQMESITYINEIDVRKVAVGQPVRITLDSDPTKQLSGTVTSVANVGEQRPNQDAKVFEVRVRIEQSDTTLRPGMTTGNTIETLKVHDALSVPLEALNSEDGVAFVYKKSGGGVSKREVATGAMNDDAVIILAGLDEGDEVLLSVPTDPTGLSLERLTGRDAPTAGGDTAVPRPVPADSAPLPD